jgi:transposase InsO family protein
MRKVRAAVVLKLVKSIRKDQPRVGTRKLYAELKPSLERAGISVGRDKFFDILRDAEELIKPKKSQVRTTLSRHRYAVAPNRTKGLVVEAPGQVLASDITYLRLYGGDFGYLFLVTDIFSRKILGYHVTRDLTHHSACIALEKAVDAITDPHGVIHHSDRGCQYCCHEYLERLELHGMLSSMTDENHCYQNAIAERINGILKDEFNLDVTFRTFDELKTSVDTAVRVYNTKRLHFSLGLRTPQEVYAQAA